jgi:hypothetical protein
MPLFDDLDEDKGVLGFCSGKKFGRPNGRSWTRLFTLAS